MTISHERDAKQHILSILPEEGARRRCLMVFADAIIEANACGKDKWAVTYKTGEVPKVRLVVGHIFICTLGNGRVWMALDKSAMAASGPRELLQTSEDWEWGTGRYAEYRQIPSRNGYYSPSDGHGDIWPGLRDLHFESIRKAADGTTMDRRTPKKHSPPILQYLRNELDRNLPDPLY